MFKINIIVLMVLVLILLVTICFGKPSAQSTQESNKLTGMVVEEEPYEEVIEEVVEEGEPDANGNPTEKLLSSKVISSKTQTSKSSAATNSKIKTSSASISDQSINQLITASDPKSDQEFIEELIEEEVTEGSTDKEVNIEEDSADIVAKTPNPSTKPNPNAWERVPIKNVKYRNALLVPHRERRVIARYKVVIPVIVPNVRVRVPMEARHPREPKSS